MLIILGAFLYRLQGALNHFEDDFFFIVQARYSRIRAQKVFNTKPFVIFTLLKDEAYPTILAFAMCALAPFGFLDLSRLMPG